MGSVHKHLPKLGLKGCLQAVLTIIQKTVEQKVMQADENAKLLQTLHLSKVQPLHTVIDWFSTCSETLINPRFSYIVGIFRPRVTLAEIVRGCVCQISKKLAFSIPIFHPITHTSVQHNFNSKNNRIQLINQLYKTFCTID